MKFGSYKKVFTISLGSMGTILRRSTVLVTCSIFTLALLISNAEQAQAQEILSLERAQGERLGSAHGHFARTRSMLLTSIRYFNHGVDYADPNSLIDVKEFRATILDRAEELERLIDPQPNLSRHGVKHHGYSKIRNPMYTDPRPSKYDAEERVAIEKAEDDDLKEAIKQFTTARSLLLDAIREFDYGLKYANPQILVDVHEWRNNIVDRAEDLERVIAPKARETETGVQYQADTRLLNPDFK